MLAKSAHFLEMYVLLHVIIIATSVMFTFSASSAFLAFVALMIELMISDKHIYLCMF